MVEKSCYVCGCTERDPCHVFGVPCCWIDTDDGAPVCSGCAGNSDTAADPVGRQWLELVLENAKTGAYVAFEPCLASIRFELTDADWG